MAANKFSNKNSHPWINQLSSFYDFVEASRKFLKDYRFQEDEIELINAIDQKVEETKESTLGTKLKEQKFDSAIYVDIQRLVTFRNFLRNYSIEDIHLFQQIIEIELNGLEGDMEPRNIVKSSIPGLVVMGIGLVIAWTALWTFYFGFDIFEIFTDSLQNKLQDIKSRFSIIATIVFVFGGFLGIGWYLTSIYQNQKRIAFLKSLQRAISLYLLLPKNN